MTERKPLPSGCDLESQIYADTGSLELGQVVVDRILTIQLPLSDDERRDLGDKFNLDSLGFIEYGMGVEECQTCQSGEKGGQATCRLAQIVVSIISEAGA
jgi:hypothetical protein